MKETGMGCFCHASLTALEAQMPRLALPSLDVALSATVSLDLAPPGASLIAALAGWLAARGQPAAPWQPDPAWMTLNLPMPQMSASAVATISALVQLRAQVLAQFNIDLLIPAQVPALARIVATMNARLTASVSLASLDLSPWIALAALNDSLDQVQAALRAGMLAPPLPLMTALQMPGGIPIGQWSALLAPLRRLAPLIAAAMQLNVSVVETAPLAAALRLLAQIRLPALAAPELMASLTVGLSAVARLQASLRLDPLQQGPQAVAARIQAKLSIVLAALAAMFGAELTLDAAIPLLLAKLPALPVAPGSLATPDVIRLAIQARALALATWQVPALPSLPSVSIGLSTCALVAQLQAALRIQAVLPAPCASGCDAASLLRAVA
jgi:hypothetical protein